MNTLKLHQPRRLMVAVLSALALPAAWAQSSPTTKGTVATTTSATTSASTPTTTAATGAASTTRATSTTASSPVGLQVGLQAGLSLGASATSQAGLQLGLGSSAAAPGLGIAADVATRIQLATGRPLSAPAQRYLTGRLPEGHPGDAGLCRDLDRTFDLQHTSYGSLSPRARRQLNDCTPTLVPFTSAP